MPPLRFRNGLDEIILVRRRDILRVSSSSRATEIAEAILAANPEIQNDSGIVREGARPSGALAERLASGELVLVRVDARLPALDPPRADPLSPDEPEQPVRPKRDEPQPELEIAAFMLHDEAGAPVPGERYLVRLSDGTQREGLTDDTGFARVEYAAGLHAEVTFPDREGSTWG